MRARLVVGAVLAGGLVAAGGWYAHEPSRTLTIPKLHVPQLAEKRAHASSAVELPEGEAASEDAPVMPVGTKELPEQLDRVQLEDGMHKLQPRLERCRGLDPFVGTITVKLTINKSGSVQSVALVSPETRTALTDCVVKAVHTASFPAFRGTLLPTIELTWPFLFQAPGASATVF